MSGARLLSLVVGFLGLVACGSDDTYRLCSVPEDCEAPPDEGAPVCLLKSSDGGFCSWECEDDADCNEADDDEYNFVCASFESAAARYCFPKCETFDGEEIACPSDMTCRSTGGGAANEKVCFPNEV